jgi:hypothetical protein
MSAFADPMVGLVAKAEICNAPIDVAQDTVRFD